VPSPVSCNSASYMFVSLFPALGGGSSKIFLTLSRDTFLQIYTMITQIRITSKPMGKTMAIRITHWSPHFSSSELSSSFSLLLGLVSEDPVFTSASLEVFVLVEVV
jgi:hypothetical protein